MARRYASAFTHATQPQSLGVGAWDSNGVISGVAGGINVMEESSRLYVAPSCYSEVRKVVFWASVRHEHGSTALTGVNYRLRIGPSSTSGSSRVIDSEAFLSNTISKVRGTGSVWPAQTVTAEAYFYDWIAAQANSPAILKYGTFDTGGSQLIYQEFDRFEASDAAFFSDWDAIAALAIADRFIAYRVGIQRDDGVAWSTGANIRPVVVACGFAVQQAPANVNNTRMMIPASFAFGSTNAISATPGLEGSTQFVYHADEWDGAVELRVIAKQKAISGGAGVRNGNIRLRVGRITEGSLTFTSIFDESYIGNVADNTDEYLVRTSDLASLLQDGDILVVQMATATSIGNENVPWCWWEITHTGFNRTPVYFPCGHQVSNATAIPDGAPPPDTYSKASSLFDPEWFEDFESFRFVSSRVQGGLKHQTAANNPRQAITLNAFIGDDVPTSSFNVFMSPDITGTPTATPGYKLVDDEITSNDPVNLAGMRTMTVLFGDGSWVSGTDDEPGTMGLRYALNVPNTDVVELGPLFDLGSFDAEGCAATSAGLGEPGILVITNGSTIPKKFNPTAAGSSSEVEDAGIPVPFEGETPQAVPSDSAASPDGGLELGTYIYRYTFRNCCTGKESDPNPDDITVDTTGQAPAAQVTFSFAGVRIPGDPQICEICLYRTLDGGAFPIMAKVGCFNVDETSIFVDDVSDSALDFLNDGLSLLNAPMPCVPIVVDFRNRLFGMGDIPNLAPAGTVSVVEDSDIVTGSDDVLWDRCLEGKFIYIGSDCRGYEVLRVLPPEVGTSPPIVRLKLVEPYTGTTDTGLSYHVCGRPNRLYFSEPLEPEYWPNANFLDIEPGDGDRLMGAVSNFDRLVICKRRKTYVLTFRENPGFEVIVPSRISSDIGCVGPRTFAQMENGSVWLADRGLAVFDGRGVMHVPESENMNDIFTDPDNPHYVRRDRNGRVIDAVGVFYPKREQYLLLLPTVQTDRGCNMMLVWDVKLHNVTLLKFCQQFQSMVVAKDASGNERVYLGDTNGFVWIYDVGDTDGVGVPNATGTVRGNVSFAGVDTDTGASVLDSDGAEFLDGGVPGVASLSGVEGLSVSWDNTQMGLAGACVYSRVKGASYDDPWVVRTIYAATPTRLYVTPEWGAETPFDPTGEFEYEFMLGPIELDLIFKPQNYGVDDTQKRNWRQIVVHESEQFSSRLRVDLLPDFQSSDPEADTVTNDAGETGAGREFRMDYSKGRQVRPVGRLIYNHMAVRMRNFAPEEPIRVINHVLCTQPSGSK